MNSRNMELVKKNGLNLCEVKKQTTDICKAAVQQNGWALAYAQMITPELYQDAVNQDPSVLVLSTKELKINIVVDL